MLVISTRKFREKQGKYLGMVARGEDIILKSRENGSFKLVPVSDDDMIISKDYILTPDADLAQAISGEEFLKGVKEDLREIFKKGKR